MDKKILEKLVNRGLNTGADFSEIFFEDKKEYNISFSNSVIDKSFVENTKGIGIRLACGKEIYYACTNDLSEENLNKKIDDLNLNFSGKRILPYVELKNKDERKKELAKDFTIENWLEIKNKLYDYDKFARSLDSRIIQFNITVVGITQKVNIANSKGVLVKEERNLTRIYLKAIVEENKIIESAAMSFAAANGLEIIDDKKVYNIIEEIVKDAIKKLQAKPSPGGEFPVIVSNLGGTLIHEACGHALEATMVSDETSILSNKIGVKIANEKVTLIDDGTLVGEWGSSFYDDEGNKTQKNILVENGVLKKYLIDELNTRNMAGSISGSGRRESFIFPPTSRMNNTYLKSGNDKFEDMISSIDFGIYAKTIGGGQVNPTTGDFTFAVLDAHIIRNGKIAEPVKGASLVGNSLEILDRIEMISDDLCLTPGLCGSVSGWVPVTTGQPTVKISKILVGGEKNDQ